MRLETERTILREMTEGDLPALRAILQDPLTMVAYEGPMSEAETRAWLQNNLRRYREDGFGLWAVILKESGRMIGQCGITYQPYLDWRVLEVGYLFNRRYWHMGYATEAARACARYAFDTLKTDELYCFVRDTNHASAAVAKRLNMTRADGLIKHYRGAVMPHDVFLLHTDHPASPHDSSDERWDEYDENGQKTGRILRRGDPLTDGSYHLVSDVLPINARGEILVQKRAPWKHLGNLWALTGGSALSGETGKDCCARETREELGFSPDMARARMIYSDHSPHTIRQVWLVPTELRRSELDLQEAEVADARWTSLDTFERFCRDQSIFHYDPYYEKLLPILRGIVRNA